MILTDGVHSSAYWEHRWIATQWAIPLAEHHEIDVIDGRLAARHVDLRPYVFLGA